MLELVGILIPFVVLGQNGEVWMMPPPAAPPNCPPGLEYMTQIDQLLVKQQIELLESECNCLFWNFFNVNI